MITSISASVPPVIASTWYSIKSISLNISKELTALIAASTGPIPTPAFKISSPSTVNFTDAVGMTLLPDTIVTSFNLILSL